MALIACHECKKEVSSQAAACIHCGAPLTRAADPASVVTTQQTAKRYKAMQLVGALMIVAGVVACSAGESRHSGWLWVLGFLVWLGGRLRGWWHHG